MLWCGFTSLPWLSSALEGDQTEIHYCLPTTDPHIIVISTFSHHHHHINIFTSSLFSAFGKINCHVTSNISLAKSFYICRIQYWIQIIDSSRERSRHGFEAEGELRHWSASDKICLSTGGCLLLEILKWFFWCSWPRCTPLLLLSELETVRGAWFVITGSDYEGSPKGSLPPPPNKSAQQREQDFPLGFVFATPLVMEYFPQIWQGGMLVCGGEVTATMGGMPNIPPVKQLFSF